MSLPSGVAHAQTVTSPLMATVRNKLPFMKGAGPYVNGGVGGLSSHGRFRNALKD